MTVPLLSIFCFHAKYPAFSKILTKKKGQKHSVDTYCPTGSYAPVDTHTVNGKWL
jgi:uncharacterized membrane protein YbaN (DUF454 family)